MTSDTAKAQFTAAQAALRTVLSRYVQVEPRAIEFRYGPHWKPYLAESYASDLQFNLSHSHELGVVGLAREREIGIDLERVRERKSARRLAQRFFGADEQAVMNGAGEEERDRTFLRLWTRKEGHLKATGTGLSVSLRDIDTVTGDTGGWWYHEFEPDDGYVAALVAHGAPLDVTYLRLTP